MRRILFFVLFVAAASATLAHVAPYAVGARGLSSVAGMLPLVACMVPHNIVPAPLASVREKGHTFKQRFQAALERPLEIRSVGIFFPAQPARIQRFVREYCAFWEKCEKA